MSDQAPYYLIIGPSWVGDMVMAQSLFIDLKERYQNARIDVLAPSWTGALIDRMPQVDALIESDLQHGKLDLGKRHKLAKKLAKKGYTHSLVLPNSLKAALIPALAKIPVRSGFIGEQRWGLLNDIRRLDKTALPMTVQRFIALGRDKRAAPVAREAIPKPKLKVDLAKQQAALEKHQLKTDSPILALCPGAEFGASKQWPIEYYAQIAQHYLQQGWQVCLMGSENDAASSQQINQANQQACSNLAGKTSLPEAIDLLRCANLVVSNDSGLMHIAAALSRPLIAIYGSTDPGHTPPLSHNHRIARLALDCSPCFKRECPLGHLDCLNKLESAMVLDYSQQLLEKAGFA